MATMTKFSGFKLITDVTPLWWDELGWSKRRPLIGKVIDAICERAPWCNEVRYAAGGEFVAVLLLPADTSLETMTQKRDALLKELEALKP